MVLKRTSHIGATQKTLSVIACVNVAIIGMSNMILTRMSVASMVMLSLTESTMGHAFDQIHKRKYYQGIRGGALLVGMVFCGKSALVRSNRVHVGKCDSIEPYVDS